MDARRRASQAAEVAIRTGTGFAADRCGIAAAGITYFALVSIFPLALVGLSVAGFVYSSEADQDQLLDTLMKHLPLEEGSGRDDLAGVIRSIVAARGTLGVLGIASALYTGSSLFTAVRVALNGIFRDEKPRSFVAGKLIDIGMVILFGGLLILSTAASFALTLLARFAEDIAGEGGAALTRLGIAAAYLTVPPLLSFGLFLLLYARIPDKPVGWKHTIPGALLAALLFEVLKGGFGQYAANFGNYDATYGSLGFVVLLLAFIYFAAQVMLLGAEAARATSEVVHAWPLPHSESRLAAAHDRFTTILATILARLRRHPLPTPPPPAPAPMRADTQLSASLVTPAGAVAPRDAQVPAHATTPTETRSPADAAAWPGPGPATPAHAAPAPARPPASWLVFVALIAAFAATAAASALTRHRR
ncbi:MAG: YihY/virulence factor BrkB family protein [Dehalococcoidia bacterium]|nr:YihY/virulence factor BrkB family protein [Dehalococcoidia bacterium]